MFIGHIGSTGLFNPDAPTPSEPGARASKSVSRPAIFTSLDNNDDQTLA
jgi:hypothetical protein